MYTNNYYHNNNNNDLICIFPNKINFSNGSGLLIQILYFNTCASTCIKLFSNLCIMHEDSLKCSNTGFILFVFFF